MYHELIAFTIGNLSQATSMLLLFAAILFVFLLLLIVVTVKVFSSGKEPKEREEEPEEEEYEEEATTVLSRQDKDPDLRKIVEETQAAVDQAIESEQSEAFRETKESGKQKTAGKKPEDNTLDFAEVRRRLAEEGQEEDPAFSPDMSDYDASQDSAFAPEPEDRSFAVEDMSEEPTSVMEQPSYEEDGYEDDDFDEDDFEEEDLREEASSEEEIPEEELPEEPPVTFGEQMSLEEYLAEQEEETVAIPENEMESYDPDSEDDFESEERESRRNSGRITVNPVNAVNIRTVNAAGPVNTINPEAGIADMQEMEDFLAENPVPKKKKKKIRKKDTVFEERFGTREGEIQGARYFWYNSQDIEDLKRKEDMYFYCHYFNQPEKAVMGLITEMYDCGFVRTEEIQKIAFGVQFRSLGMKEILSARENISFDKSKAVKTPDEQDRKEISRKWREYVDQFLEIIVLNAPEDIQEAIRDRLYVYGDRDPEELIYSPL